MPIKVVSDIFISAGIERREATLEQKAIYDTLRWLNFDEIKRAIKKVNGPLTNGEVIWLMFHDWGLDLSVT